MKSRILLLALGLLLCTHAAFAQVPNPCGTNTFFKTYGSESTDEQGISLISSGDGNLYATGLAGNRALLSKLDTAGQVIWSRGFSFDSARTLRLYEIITDSENKIVVVGSEAGDSPLTSNGVVMRYDPVKDSVLWIKRVLPSPSLGSGILEKTPGGNFILYQTILPDSTLVSQIEVLELERATGNNVASKAERISRVEPILISQMLSVGNALYAVGAQQMPNPALGARHLLMQLDTTNYQPQWAKISHINAQSVANLISEDLLVDNDTLVSLYANVDTSGGSVKNQIFLQKATLTGDLLWVKQYDLPQTTTETPLDLVKMGTGYGIYGLAGNEYFVLATDHDGNVQKGIRFNNGTATATTFLPFAKSEAFVQTGRLYLQGGFEGSNTDISLLKTTSDLNSQDSCGYVLSLDSVTVTTIANPFSTAVALQVSPSPAQVVDTSAVFITLSLEEKRLCPALQPSLLLNLGPDIITCKDTTFVLDAGPGFVSYLWQDSTTAQTLTTTKGTGIYWVEAVDSCGIVQRDSVFVTVNLSGDTKLPDLTLCKGDSIVFDLPGFDHYEWAPNFGISCDTCAKVTIQPDSTRQYTLFATSLDGCLLQDTFTLTVALPVTLSDTLQACEGDSIVLNGIAYYFTQTVVDTLLAFGGGCDTVATYLLQFDPRPTRSIQVSLCQGDAYEINGATYTQDVMVMLTVPAPTGCDSSIVYDVKFKPLPTLHDTLTSCANDTIFFEGGAYTADTILVDTLMALPPNCDTLQFTHLVFTPLHTQFDTLTACANDTIFVGGLAYTKDTVLVDTLSATTGCDTVRTRNLVFLPLPIQADTMLACAGDTITLGGVAFTQDTTVQLSIIPSSGPGCDTLKTAHLIFRPWPITADTLTACAGDTIVFQGVAYLKDTTVTVDTLPASGGGCDTLVQKTLIFKPLPMISETLTACEGDTILFQGVKYVQDTTLMLLTIPSTTGGCDTLVMENLVFNPIPSFTDSLQLCQGDTVSIGGIQFFQDTIFVSNLPSTTGGCDTVATYVLKVLPRPFLSDTLQLCEGDTVIIGGIKFFQDTLLTDTLASTTGGCDTLSTHWIVVSPTPKIDKFIQFIPGDTVTVNGVKYTIPIIIKDTIPATVGCDTLRTYTLQWLTKLTLTCPPDLTVTTAQGDSTTVVDYDLPTVNTSCPGGGVPTITLLKGLPVGGTFGLGTVEICYIAADTCGNVDTCCFKITVEKGENACDVKVNDCLRWELMPIKLDSLGNRRYRIKVVNNCTEKLNYVLFRLPNGIQALEPIDGSVFAPQPSTRKYIVRNPNFSPVYSVRFKADSATVLNKGAFDVFEYKLPQQSAPTYIYTYAKLADGTYFEAHLNTFNCPELPWPNFAPTPDDRRGSHPSGTAGTVELYPNPTNGLLFLDLGGIASETVTVRILNALGQVVQSSTLPAADGVQSLELNAGLKTGVYQLVLQPKDGSPVVERFVLERD